MWHIVRQPYNYNFSAMNNFLISCGPADNLIKMFAKKCVHSRMCQTQKSKLNHIIKLDKGNFHEIE